MSFLHQTVKIFLAAVSMVEIKIVDHSISIIPRGRDVDWRKPYRIDTQICQIVQPFDDSSKSWLSKLIGNHAIDHGCLHPSRVFTIIVWDTHLTLFHDKVDASAIFASGIILHG